MDPDLKDILGFVPSVYSETASGPPECKIIQEALLGLLPSGKSWWALIFVQARGMNFLVTGRFETDFWPYRWHRHSFVGSPIKKEMV